MEFTDFLQEMFSREYNASLRACLNDLRKALPEQGHSVLAGIMESACRPGKCIDIKGIPAGLNCGPQGADKSSALNTFPFGEQTNELYPNYIGIATRSSTLTKVLDDAEQHCWKLSRMNKPFDEKTVIILTDKWDIDRFRRYYERDFMRYAMRDNVLFIFLLVTDYGVSTIPFLPWDHVKLKEIAHVYMNSGLLEENPTLTALCQAPSIFLDIDEQGAPHKCYSFRFCNRTWTYREGVDCGDGASAHGNFCSCDINGFAADIADFHGTPSDYPNTPKNGGCNFSKVFRAMLLDQTYTWYEGDEAYKELEDAYSVLINGLDPV